ncbi:T9SS type A sorting domain-containing protein [Aestuariivivens sediminis]|uniref:T9SS type A sorting domain-containing protein n=1 Tax=Aestuariivivens sediminis TaxID=2913557 RepID=UPI001F56708F|nr:T9SS type A sorting domain-containing protein [Aestuariivivens sediminis]
MKQIITLLFLAAFTVVGSAQIIIDGNPYGNNPYASIADALTDSTNPADVILITGAITESVTINQSITLRGTDPTVDIIQAAASASNDGTGQRVITINGNAQNLNVVMENLGIRYGNFTDNGGGINIDKVTGSVTLNNLIIVDNFAAKNGGGIGIAGSNVDIINCTIQNNSCGNGDGGGLIVAPNNGASVDNVINVKQSLIDSNSSNNGGGIYINGNNGFGDQYRIECNIENSTISNNIASSGSGGAGGGGIWAKAADYIGTDGNGGANTSLQLVHATLYNNNHSGTAVKNGIQFTSAGTEDTNFQAFNSIIVTADVLSEKALNFANSNTIEVINCILGGLQNPNTGFLDNAARNNQRGKTATYAGLTGTLTDAGGSTLVIPITESSTADDYCTAATGIAIPTTDQRGYSREGIQDAGAFEFGGTLSVESEVLKVNTLKIFPNPVKSTLHISSLNTITRAFIYDMTGKRVYQSQTIYNNSLNVSHLKVGLYTLKVEDVDHNWSSSKLVVSR